MRTPPTDSALMARRILLRMGLTVWFCVLAFWLGPRLILFHSLRGMEPADFIPIVQKYCVPAVREIKIYQRDHGRMPDSEQDLSPAFNNHHGNDPAGFGVNMLDRRGGYSYLAIGMYKHEVEYDFTPGHEGWTVHGAFANGPIPLPPVVLDPLDTASTKP